VNNFA
jgi:hypothetical protein